MWLPPASLAIGWIQDGMLGGYSQISQLLGICGFLRKMHPVAVVYAGGEQAPQQWRTGEEWPKNASRAPFLIPVHPRMGARGCGGVVWPLRRPQRCVIIQRAGAVVTMHVTSDAQRRIDDRHDNVMAKRGVMTICDRASHQRHGPILLPLDGRRLHTEAVRSGVI